MTTYSGNAVFIPGLVAGSSLATAQYKAVALSSTAGQVKVAAAGGGIGILQNDPAAGEAALVMAIGISKAVASTGIAIGAKITGNSTGVVTTLTANHNVLGIALEAAANTGDIIRVLLTGPSNY